MNYINKSMRNQILFASLALVLLASLLASPAQPAAAGGSASLSCISVQAGQSITIKVTGMPANTAVTVRMDRYGTKAADGAIAGTTVTASNGALKATYAIPSSLKNEKKIDVRVEVTADPKQFVYNWFNNTTSSGSSNAPIPSGTMSSGNITITNVNEDKDVTISVAGAPAGAKLAVWFDWENSSGAMVGKQAGTLKVNADGTLKATIKMPAAARDRANLRIRLQGTNGSSYLAYKWFLNSEDDYTGGGAPTDSTSGLPYLMVVSVVKDASVTIQAFNFPAGDYVVRMDVYGSDAKKGIKVDTFTIKQGKTYTSAFEIPDQLIGQPDIAIRVQNVNNSSYYAYTWFDNVTSN